MAEPGGANMGVSCERRGSSTRPAGRKFRATHPMLRCSPSVYECLFVSRCYCCWARVSQCVIARSQRAMKSPQVETELPSSAACCSVVLVVRTRALRLVRCRRRRGCAPPPRVFLVWPTLSLLAGTGWPAMLFLGTMGCKEAQRAKKAAGRQSFRSQENVQCGCLVAFAGSARRV